MAAYNDLLQVLLFIIVFIVIHIIIVHVSSRNLSLTLKQRIVVDDGPVIHLKSASRQKINKVRAVVFLGNQL